MEYLSPFWVGIYAWLAVPFLVFFGGVVPIWLEVRKIRKLRAEILVHQFQAQVEGQKHFRLPWEPLK